MFDEEFFEKNQAHYAAIGKICREKRESLCMSLNDLSIMTGWQVQDLQLFEEGKGPVRTFKFREPICKALGLTDRELAPWPEDLPEIYGEIDHQYERKLASIEQLRDKVKRERAINFVKVLQIYKKESKDIQEVVDSMMSIIVSQNSDEDEIIMAADTVVEALFHNDDVGTVAPFFKKR